MTHTGGMNWFFSKTAAKIKFCCLCLELHEKKMWKIKLSALYTKSLVEIITVKPRKIRMTFP